MNKKLTLQLVHNKTKCDNLLSIRNLNLWGNELRDISLISEMVNLEIVSLSVNNIHTLSPFANCTKLEELYLRKNSIQDTNQLAYLVALSSLKKLWLSENPICDIPDYRLKVIKVLPNLQILDQKVITPQELDQAQNVHIHLDRVELALPQVQEEQQFIPQQEEPQYNRRQSNYQEPQQYNRRQSNYQEEEYKRQSSKIQEEPAYNRRQSNYQEDEYKRESSQIQEEPQYPRRQSSQIQEEVEYKKRNYLGEEGQQVRRQGSQRGGWGGVQRQDSLNARQDSFDMEEYNPPIEPPFHNKTVKMDQTTRQENILCAVLALLKELDQDGLEFVKRDIDRRL